MRIGSMMFYFDLKQRINSSPQTTAGYPIYLSTNCEGGFAQSYVIPVSDPDGDVVRCRCYDNDYFSGLTLDTNACSFTFNPTEVGWYAIYITIEDFAPTDLNVPLSSIPLVIGAYVDSNPSKCCKLILVNFEFKILFFFKCQKVTTTTTTTRTTRTTRKALAKSVNMCDVDKYRF